jgi:integrase
MPGGDLPLLKIREVDAMKGYRERDGKIYVRVTRRDKTTHKRKEIWRKVDSKSDVKKVRREIENDLDDPGGLDALTNKDSLNEYLDSWLVVVKPTVRQRTHEDYKNIARLYIRPHLGAKKLKAIDETDIEVWLSTLQASFGNRTVRYAYTVLRMALKRAKRRKLISVNPTEDIDNLPQKQTREMLSLTEDQAIRFLFHAKAKKQWLIFKFALYTGMRPEEYLALQWKDVDLTEGTATIQRVIFWPHWEKRGSWKFESPKTEKSRRTLDLPLSLVADLKSHKAKQSEYRLKQGEKFKNLDLVFPSEAGTPICYRNLSRAFKPILEKAELPDIRLYDLRHSFASLLLTQDENIKVISELLGHATTRQTQDTYLHVMRPMKRRSMNKLDKRLNKRS